ncbi:hypothetical protein HD597_008739 [Nonomuraea thailandensis]|uniref:Uncharacterized protein n=1 Tax=Nonomuraea thailandensis TaxID=1188745 RepID=A0A9X2K6Q4_9ACTN|nr:hypothetical protein [Nonomuraea thailandensis]
MGGMEEFDGLGAERIKAEGGRLAREAGRRRGRWIQPTMRILKVASVG